jgi:uncharacterized membrane protein
MSKRREPGEPPPRSAVAVLAVVLAILLLIAYPFALREALRGADPLVAALAKLPLVLVNLALAWRFGVTLRAGREPMIARFARAERGSLEPDLARYTRGLTVAWVVFFVLMALVAAVLAVVPSQAAWQWWSSVGNWLCVAAFFAGEWLYRRLRFRHYRHASLWRQLSLVTRRFRG